MIREFQWLSIAFIEETDPGVVYDFTTVSDNHSFIANGFVTHNCGIVKTCTVVLQMSLENDVTVLENMVISHRSYSYEQTESQQSIVILNGILLGYCNGRELENIFLWDAIDIRFHMMLEFL